MPEPSVTLQASQIAGAITFISICLGLVVALALIEMIDGWVRKKKKNKWPPSKGM